MPMNFQFIIKRPICYIQCYQLALCTIKKESEIIIYSKTESFQIGSTGFGESVSSNICLISISIPLDIDVMGT